VRQPVNGQRPPDARAAFARTSTTSALRAWEGWRVIYANLSSILGAAVADGLLATNPCSRRIALPSKPERVVVPWSATTVDALRVGLPERYREIVTVAAGVGLRQGEVFGLAVDDVDFLRGWVRVRHQVKIVGGQLVLAAPKRNKTRTVPLAETVAIRLAEHLRKFPAVELSLPWNVPGGRPTTFALSSLAASVVPSIGTTSTRTLEAGA
jgi:integrase